MTLFLETESEISACCGTQLELHSRYRSLLAQGRDVVIPPGAFVCTSCGRAYGHGA